MRKTLLSKFWLLLLCTIVGVNSAWADNYSATYNYNDLKDMLSGDYADASSYWKVPSTAGQTATIAIPITVQPTSNITITFSIATFGSGNGPSSSNTTISAVGTETGSNWSGNNVSSYPSSSTYVNGVMTITKPTSPTTLGGLTITMGVNTGVKIFRLKSITISYTYAAASVATPTFSVAAGTYTSAQNVELSCSTAGATIYYTLDGSTPTSSSNVYSSAISVSETKTIKAIAIKGSDASNVASATYSIYPVLNAGTEEDPYTVSDARNAIDANIGVTEKYATGIVSEIVTAYNSTYKNISFNISTDGLTTSDQLQAYRCKGATGIDASEVKVGDIVIVNGNLTKHNSTYEFAEACEVTSISHPTTPLITVAPNSLSGFTYSEGNGPSDVKTFSVEGSNLTADISLSLGESSNFEMSTNEGSGYTNTIYLTPTAGTITETTIYVRLKAGLTINTYNGTITLSSTDATDKTISLSGSVTAPNFTWDLSTDQTTTASENEMTWVGTYASMAIAKGKSSTNANNYYPGTDDRTSTRFYSGSNLTIAPASGYTITSIVFTATTDGYATALKNSTWTNATASANEKTVTITPSSGPVVISAAIGATCGFTEVKVYYTTVDPVSVTLNASGYATFASNKALDFSDDSEYSAWQITSVTSSSITFSQITGTVAAGTGVLLKGTASANIDIPVAATGSDISETNKLEGITTATDITANAYYGLSGNKFVKVNAGTVPAGKALLPASEIPASARELMFIFEDETTGITTLKTFFNDNKAMYNLKGQRIDAPRKGEIYIMGGKKMVKK